MKESKVHMLVETVKLGVGENNNEVFGSINKMCVSTYVVHIDGRFYQIGLALTISCDRGITKAPRDFNFGKKWNFQYEGIGNCDFPSHSPLVFFQLFIFRLFELY